VVRQGAAPTTSLSILMERLRLLYTFLLLEIMPNYDTIQRWKRNFYIAVGFVVYLSLSVYFFS
jgi:hypothetical protein